MTIHAAKLPAGRRHPSPLLLGPQWFTSVMGTGIVATAAATLPVHSDVLDAVATGAWVAAVTVLATLLAATAARWAYHPEAARGDFEHPTTSHFLGAPPMALMTVGAGALLVGGDVVGRGTALGIDLVLWPIGTALGLWALWAVPRRTRRRPGAYAGAAFGGWLLPVVPPMVSAATGALLVPRLPAAARGPMIVACCALFVATLLAVTPLIAVIVARVTRGEIGAAATVPALFIVLGPLGQSATAALGIGARAGGIGPTVGVAYAAPVLVAAAVWLAVAVRLVVRTARHGLPFALSWWSFTFPVGTVVTGTSGLAAATGAVVLDLVAVILFAVLVAAWAVVAVLTIRGVLSGELLRGDANPAQHATVTE